MSLVACFLFKMKIDETLLIHRERLIDDRVEEISSSVPVENLDLNDKELQFQGNVELKGKAYIAGTELIIHLDILCKALMPCKVCNQAVLFEIEVRDYVKNLEVKAVRSGVYRLANDVREAILLEIPPYTECSEGQCLERKQLKKYLKNELESKDTFLAFSELEI